MEVEKYNDFRDLEVWKRCRDIRKKIWNLYQGLPEEEKYRLSNDKGIKVFDRLYRGGVWTIPLPGEHTVL